MAKGMGDFTASIFAPSVPKDLVAANQSWLDQLPAILKPPKVFFILGALVTVAVASTVIAKNRKKK